MSIEHIFNLVAPYPMAAVFVWLWWAERQDRMKAEKRERAVLREAAGLPDSDALNGD